MYVDVHLTTVNQHNTNNHANQPPHYIPSSPVHSTPLSSCTSVQSSSSSSYTNLFLNPLSFYFFLHSRQSCVPARARFAFLCNYFCLYSVDLWFLNLARLFTSHAHQNNNNNNATSQQHPIILQNQERRQPMCSTSPPIDR